MLKLVFFVPETHLELLKEALFKAGAGKSDNYSHCCWQTAGTMQYKAEKNSNPTIGNQNELVVTKDFRVEMVCPEELIKKVVTVLKIEHPYEVPAYELYKLETNPTELET